MNTITSEEVIFRSPILRSEVAVGVEMEMTFLDWFISFTHIDPVTCTPLKAFEDFTLKWLAHYKWNRKYHPRYSSAVYHRCKE